MKKRWSISLILVLAMSMFLAACSEGNDGNAGGDGAKKEEKTDLQLGTGSTGGTYYPLGQEIATVLNNNVDVEGFNVSAVSTGASTDNLARIARGELQLGMTVHVPALEAKEGKGEFEGAKVENFGFMGHIYPEVMQIVTLGSTGVNKIEDLKGKKVAIGPPGSGTQAISKIILEAYGLKDGDYQAFEEGFGDAAKKLQDGQIDATFGLLGLPAASIDELQAVTKDVKFLEISGDALEAIKEKSGYGEFTIEAGTFEWLKDPVDTVTAYAVLVGSTDQISEDLGYEITKALYENADQISHEQGNFMTIENVLNGSEGLDFHPGAEKYFKEKGLLD